MSGARSAPTMEGAEPRDRADRWVRMGSLLLLFGTVLAQIPVVSAHDGTGFEGLTVWHGTLVLLSGVLVTGAMVLLKRTNRISPTLALYGVFFGLVVAVAGAILFEGLAPDRFYTADSMPFPRSWYPAIGLVSGLSVALLSFGIGWLRWPDRPRYAFFGLVVGFWLSYPYLVPGQTSTGHPLGYALVLGTPVIVGYILWQDVWTVVEQVLQDPVARRFGLGIGILVGLFFMAVSGYLSFFFDEGVPHDRAIEVLPVTYQLVTWPTLEVVLPEIPLFVALSIGIVTVVGTLSVLVGLNAAVIARHWRVEEHAGAAEGAAGSVAIVGACTCGCCGPLVAKVAVLAAGPTFAAPVYWVFVDTASPLGSLFIIGSIALFTGSLVYSVETALDPGVATSIVPPDEATTEGR